MIDFNDSTASASDPAGDLVFRDEGSEIAGGNPRRGSPEAERIAKSGNQQTGPMAVPE
jgi:hypothetical protein